ncbi:MAG: hypothetical protein K1X72_25190 [Pyrinomonadaceae bacterium]|nr:hypothetical protein [Pyrinomonadaceae bacterium]
MKLVALTFLMILNSTCGFSFGSTAPVSDSKPKAVENQNNSNTPKTVAKVQTASTKTGTYRYKSGSYINAIGIEELGGDKLKVVLGANYEYKIDGDWLANSGSAEGIVTLDGNKAVLVPEGSQNCQILMDFLAPNKLKVQQDGVDSDCGFGSSVNASGVYVKVSDDPNQVEADEMPPGQRISFERGKTSATVSDSIENRQNKTYIIGARSGHNLEIKITDSGVNNDVVFYLITPDGKYPMGEGEYDSVWRGKLTESGDYRIVVGTIESENTNFKMTVLIR